MPDLPGGELLQEWRRLMESLAGKGKAELPRQLLEPMQRQLEIVEEVLERERRLQGELVGRVTAPLDAVFDLLEESATVLGKQAEALEAAGTALQDTARLVKHQADLFERTVSTLRAPTKAAKAIAGVPTEKKKPRKKAAAEPKGKRVRR
jgi:hypothetical protein